MGQDPRRQDEELKSIPTLAQFAQERYLPHIQRTKRSWKGDDSILRQHILPRLGRVYLDELTPDAIVAMMVAMKAKGLANGTCNRPVIILRHMLNLAREWDVPRMERNPASKVELLPETERQRFLSATETKRLMESVRADENAQAAQAIELLLLTGARRNEITQARWEHVDLDRQSLLVPLSKSGKPRTIALNAAAVALLKQLPSHGVSPWLFPSPRTDKPSPSLYYPWDRMRRRAGLPDLRLHDLRHSYASNLVNGGVSLYVVQQLLGHANPRTTQRYSHLERDTLTKASEVAGQTVLRAVGDTPVVAEPVDGRRRRDRHR